MPTFRKGSIHLFRFLGVDVFMHWSWLVVAYIQVMIRIGPESGYTSRMWPILEYVGLFGIVLVHEFGHALACRSTGGRADKIILWPLGGVAFVDPPPRPGATLWSIAAGPLVNVLFVPILGLAFLAARTGHLQVTNPNLYQYIFMMWWINLILLGFNLLPIYPMDGGQILQSILWFWLGRARSLMVACIVGLVLGVGALAFLVIKGVNDPWLFIIGAFVLLNCWGGLQQARAMTDFAAAPRRHGLACPQCKAAPPVGNYWGCGHCRTAFDMFATHGVCPSCGMIYNVVRCQECGQFSPLPSFGEPLA